MILKKKKRVKMYHKIKKTLFLLLVVSLPLHVVAQEEKSDCVLKLELAQSKYDQGRIQDVESQIKQCLVDNEFNNVEKAQALKLLTLAYLFLEEPEKAEVSMLDLLRTNHEFTINKAIDPSGFINLYNKFRHDPVFSAGVLLGGTMALPIISSLNSHYDLTESPRQHYIPKFGFRGGFTFEYKLNEKIYLNPGLNFSYITFNKTRDYEKIVSKEPNGNFESQLSFNIIELPLLVQYQFIEGNVRPYVATGVAPQFYTSASLPGDAINNTITGSPTVTSKTINLNSDIDRFCLSVMIAGGIKVKLPGGFLNARVRYSHGLMQITKESSYPISSNSNLSWDLNDSLDGFRIHDFSLSVGYTYHIFIPKKLN